MPAAYTDTEVNALSDAIKEATADKSDYFKASLVIEAALKAGIGLIWLHHEVKDRWEGA